MKLVAGNSNRPLAEAIAAALGSQLTRTSIRRFADSEIFIEILDNVRGEDVFLIQSTSTPTNDNLMELLVCLDALKRASARRVTAVMPYYGYARQDRKSAPRTPISAKLVANLIEAGGATGFSPSTCMRVRSRVFSTFRWTISTRRRSWSNTSSRTTTTRR